MRPDYIQANGLQPAAGNNASVSNLPAPGSLFTLTNESTFTRMYRPKYSLYLFAGKKIVCVKLTLVHEDANRMLTKLIVE